MAVITTVVIYLMTVQSHMIQCVLHRYRPVYQLYCYKVVLQLTEWAKLHLALPAKKPVHICCKWFWFYLSGTSLENRGMRANMNKTKVMISGEWQKVMQKAVRWPCGVCGRGVGNNSVQCTTCQKLVHRKCSGIKGSMYKVMKTFICRVS